MSEALELCVADLRFRADDTGHLVVSIDGEDWENTLTNAELRDFLKWLCLNFAPQFETRISS